MSSMSDVTDGIIGGLFLSKMPFSKKTVNGEYLRGLSSTFSPVHLYANSVDSQFKKI
jgi:hypothetical protein